MGPPSQRPPFRPTSFIFPDSLLLSHPPPSLCYSSPSPASHSSSLHQVSPLYEPPVQTRGASSVCLPSCISESFGDTSSSFVPSCCKNPTPILLLLCDGYGVGEKSMYFLPHLLP